MIDEIQNFNIESLMSNINIIINDNIDQENVNMDIDELDQEIENIFNDPICQQNMHLGIYYEHEQLNFSDEYDILITNSTINGLYNGYNLNEIIGSMFWYLNTYVYDQYDINTKIKQIVKPIIIQYRNRIQQRNQYISLLLNLLNLNNTQQKTLSELKFDNMFESVYGKDISINDKFCNICQDEYIDTDKITKLTCSEHHCFHTNCIKEWITKSHASCPICRKCFITEEQNNINV
jgi:hypothetical protein